MYRGWLPRLDAQLRVARQERRLRRALRRHVRRDADRPRGARSAAQVTHSGLTLSTVAQPRAIQRPNAPGVGLAPPPSPTGAHVARLGACTSPVGLTPSGQWRTVEDSAPTVCAQVKDDSGAKPVNRQVAYVRDLPACAYRVSSGALIAGLTVVHPLPS